MKGDDFTIEHNTIVRSHYTPLSIWGTSENITVRDNLVHDVGRSDVHLAREGDWTSGSGTAIDWDCNLYWSPEEADRVFEACDAGCVTYEWLDWQGTLGHDPNGYLADPIFASPHGRAWPHNSLDFQLVVGSPCIGAASDGTNIGTIQGQVVSTDPSPDPVSPVVIALAPNPFTRHTSLTLTGPGGAPVSIRVFDTGGCLVRTLTDHARARARAAWRELPGGVDQIGPRENDQRATGLPETHRSPRAFAPVQVSLHELDRRAGEHDDGAVPETVETRSMTPYSPVRRGDLEVTPSMGAMNANVHGPTPTPKIRPRTNAPGTPFSGSSRVHRPSTAGE